MQILFKTLVGSRLYGLATESSDFDYRGFGIPSRDEILGLNRLEQDETKNLQANEEGTIFSLNKYFHLLMKGNPTVFELAFADQKYHKESIGVGLDITKFVREHFTTKHVFKPYNAYFTAQRHELNNTKRTGKRLDLVKQFGYDVKFASHAVRLGYQCIELMETGSLNPTLQGEQRETCFGIKTGSFSLSQVNDILNHLDKKMYLSYKASNLPEKPDYKVINDFLVQKYAEHIRNNSWIPISDRLPQEGIRVLASSDSLDPGEDCYIGYKRCTFGEVAAKGFFDFGEKTWRYTFDQKPVRKEIAFWQYLPNPPGYVPFDIANLGLKKE